MSVSDFESHYADVLCSHVRSPSERGLQAAYELGRRALGAELSMLELVSVHLRCRRQALGIRGLDGLEDMDTFLREALTAFEITQRGYLESNRAVARAMQRVQLLRGMSDAYLQIAGAASYAERIEQVCVQARSFLDAADARLEFGRPSPPDPELADRDEMSVSLDGSGGRLTLRAHAGRTWSEVDRATLAQLAVLISAPIDDARRLEFAQRLEHLGALIADARDVPGILDGLTASQAGGAGGPQVGLWLDGDELAAHRSPPGGGEHRGDVLATVARGSGPYFAQRGEDEAWAVVPLDGASGRLGAIGFWYEDRQPFDAVQREFLAQLADRVAVAVERVRAYERERTARREAEVASERFRALQELATELARAATRRRVGQVLLRRAVEAAGAAGGMVIALADSRRIEVLAASGPFASGPDGSEGEPSGVEEVLAELQGGGTAALRDGLTPAVRARLDAVGACAVELHPIDAGRRTVGVLVICWSPVDERRNGRELLRAQVAMAGPALHRAERYDTEHDIADTLQRSILARPSVSLPGIRWSVHYRAGSAGLAGGDWYDLYPLDDRRLAIAVGDVVGQGVHAAAIMGQLRSATRAMAALLTDPGELVAALDDYVMKTAQGEYSSMAFLVLDTETGALRHTIAGHPPPVLRLPDGTTELIETGRGPLLGIACERTTVTRVVPPGTLLVLYTDGLVERRNESVDAGLDRLQALIAARGGDLEPDALCPALAAALVPPDEAVDDVAIVAVELLADGPADVPDRSRIAHDAHG